MLVFLVDHIIDGEYPAKGLRVSLPDFPHPTQAPSTGSGAPDHARLTQMQKSKVIEVNGVFVGAAVMLPNSRGWRFVAAHVRAREADGATAPTFHDAQMLARRAFVTSRLDRVLSS